MDDPMIERLAKAIYVAHCASLAPPVQQHWDTDPEGRRLATRGACAAIKAMREPPALFVVGSAASEGSG